MSQLRQFIYYLLIFYQVCLQRQSIQYLTDFSLNQFVWLSLLLQVQEIQISTYALRGQAAEPCIVSLCLSDSHSVMRLGACTNKKLELP